MKIRMPKKQIEDLDMMPMVDVIFQLIIFFMIASSFVEESKVYKVSVPKADTPQTISTEEAWKIAITKNGDVAPSGALHKDEKFERLAELVATLKHYKEKQLKLKKEPVVVIEGDKEAQYQRIIQVWNAVKNAGIRQVSFQVEPGQPKDFSSQ